MALGKRATKVVSVTTSAPTTPILAANAARIGYLIVNTGSYDVGLAEVSTVTADTASTGGQIVKGATSPPDSLLDLIDGGPVYARATGGTTTLLVVEYLAN